MGLGQATAESVHVPGAQHHWIGSFYFWFNKGKIFPVLFDGFCDRVIHIESFLINGNYIIVEF